MSEEDPSKQPEVAATDSSPDVVAIKAPDRRHPLASRIVQLWTIENGIGLGLLLLGTSAAVIALIVNTDAPKLLLVLIWVAVFSLFLMQLLWFPKREYDRWSYEMTDQTLELRFGVIWEKAVLIPLSRLQHVDLHRGPLERHFGLSSLEIHTAGTKNASHKIPGLEPDIAIQLRDELVRAAQIETP